MASSSQPIVTKSPRSFSPPTIVILGFLLVLVASIWLAAAPVLVPPAVVPATAPATEFSGERASRHLRVIASEPHTVGSPAQARLRAYLVQEIRALGLEPQIQAATAALPGKGGMFASNLQNILVRIPGSQSSGAVAIMAHYDSQPNTPGASDNGAAVAGLLETLRAIQAGPQLRNDLIFIFTDAEEVDAQGAEAFFYQHPWAKDIRALVNFEGAGNRGASMLLEVSPGNRRLVEGFLKGASHPVAYSFLTQLLSIMPLGTDMTVFAENGVPSLSPMFGWGYHVLYHSSLDNVAVLDPRSVQHQGENGLGLARFFGNQDLASLKTGEDQVFFVLLPGVMIQYPAGWAIPLVALAAISLAVVIFFGFRRRQLSFTGLLGGIGSALALVIVPLVAAALAWMILSALHPEFWRNIMGSPYQADVYLAGLLALMSAADLALFIWLRRKVSLAHLALGAVLLWLVLAGLTSFALPGMSYLFTWPAFISTLGLAVMILRPAGAGSQPLDRADLAARFLSGALAILLAVPVILLLFMLVGFWFLMMTPSVPFILVPLLIEALLLALMAPQMDLLVRRRAWLWPVGTGILAFGLLAAASLLGGFRASQPAQNGVWYTLDADQKAAAWYSFGEKPADAWTKQFFPGAIEPVDLETVYAAISGNPMPPAAYKGEAPVASLPAPELALVSDETLGDLRTLKLHLSSPRLARGLLVKVSGAPVLAAAVNANRQSDPAWLEREDWYLRFYGMTAEGLDLQLEVKPGTGLTIIVTDQSDGLPQLDGVTYSPRTPAMMPFALAQEYMPFPETASVSKTFRLP